MRAPPVLIKTFLFASFGDAAMKTRPPLASEAIRSLEPYTSARMLNALSDDGIYLDANEAPETFDFPPVDLRHIRHYADDKAGLERRAAGFYGVSPGRVLAMRGIDEAVDLIIRAFCEPGRDTIAALTPTYGGYGVAAAAHRIAFRREPFGPGGTIDVAAASAHAPRVIFLCRPNNPTGALTPLGEVEALAEAVGEETLVAVDEAYIEFADAPSALDLLADFGNIVVMRTMSKAFGLAGAHVGFAIGEESIVGALAKIINPYPVPDPCLQLAEAAFSEAGLAFLKRRIEVNARVRDAFARRLAEVPGCREVLPSDASFVAARFDDARAAYEALRARRIFIRPLAPMLGSEGWLRFSIGTEEDMERVLLTLGAP